MGGVYKLKKIIFRKKYVIGQLGWDVTTVTIASRCHLYCRMQDFKNRNKEMNKANFLSLWV